MNYMDLLGGGFPPGFEGQMPQPQQMQGMGGLFGGAGPPPQASQLPGVTQMPRFGQTPLQGMGLQSPFMTERPQQALPTQGFMPSRTNAMGPNAMSMMGMNPNFGNMVGPTSALPPEMQPQASQLRMWGMEDQMAQPAPGGGGGGGGGTGMGGGGMFNENSAAYFPAVANELINRGPGGQAYTMLPGRFDYQDAFGNRVPKNSPLFRYLADQTSFQQDMQGGGE